MLSGLRKGINFDPKCDIQALRCFTCTFPNHDLENLYDKVTDR